MRLILSRINWACDDDRDMRLKKKTQEVDRSWNVPTVRDVTDVIDRIIT